MKSEAVILARRVKFSILRKELKKDREENPLEYPPDIYEKYLLMLNKIIETLDWCLENDNDSDFSDVQAMSNIEILLSHMKDSEDENNKDKKENKEE